MLRCLSAMIASVVSRARVSLAAALAPESHVTAQTGEGGGAKCGKDVNGVVFARKMSVL